MIYLDYQATTPLAPEARDAMLLWLDSGGLAGAKAMGFANPYSAHRPGRAAAAAVEVAREQVAGLFPSGGTVIFTSGATEAINLALFGRNAQQIAVSHIEHAAVLDAAQASGAEIQHLPVNADGVLNPDIIIPHGSDLVAVMQVNNELGTIQPIAEIAQRTHAAGALLLCDAVQGAGRLPPPAGADLIAISAHKIYGPKGIGALWVRDGVKLNPQIHGGGQQGGLRSGTLSPALCAGFGAAAALCKSLWTSDAEHVEQLWTLARAALSDWTLNGSDNQRYHGNLSIRRDGLDTARLMSDCRHIAISVGSACASGSGRPSHVLRAIGLSEKQAKNTIRIGFGRYTTPREIEDACAQLNAAAAAQGI
jgi:cysteine desulfurase